MVAWYLASNPGALRLGTNNGDLITPPQTTQPDDFKGADNFSSEHFNELQGHWVLVNVVQQAECLQVCLDSLHKSRQITLMMGKDIARIRRLALLEAGTTVQILTQEWQDDARLIKASASPRLVEAVTRVVGKLEPGMLVIMDPLGNLMMKYAVGYDPYKVRNDLSKLLRISQIG